MVASVRIRAKSSTAVLLQGRRAIRSVLTKHASLRDEFQDRYGDKYVVAREWWDDYGDRLEIVDLRPLVPGLAALQLDDP